MPRRESRKPSLVATNWLPSTRSPGGPAVVYGAVLIALMFLLPDGVAGLFRRVRGLLSRS